MTKALFLNKSMNNGIVLGGFRRRQRIREVGESEERKRVMFEGGGEGREIWQNMRAWYYIWAKNKWRMI